MKNVATNIAMLCLIFLSALVLRAQDLGRLSVDDALNLRQFCQLTPIGVSPDGRWLAYTVADNRKAKTIDDERWPRSGVPPWVVETDIWILNLKSHEIRNLTGGKGDNWLPVWSPDAHYLGFVSQRDGSGQARLWIWDAMKDELKRVSDIDIRGNQIAWTPDSR